MHPPLSSIAERSPASGGEDSDEEEEEGEGGGWRVGGDAAAKIPRGADMTIKSGYLSKKGERRKVRASVVLLWLHVMLKIHVMYMMCVCLMGLFLDHIRRGRNAGSCSGHPILRSTRTKPNTNFSDSLISRMCIHVSRYI